ncbi:MAG: PaaX family transcriptional regulator C-terminal domain-containing protein [Burkholderiales bacterium]
MNLLLAAEHELLGATEAVQACALFGISGNAARVALARLARADLIEPAERGEYRLGPKGRALGADVATWRQSGRPIRAWDGGWIAVLTAGHARSDRKALRRRGRALALVGMRELEPGLYVRPDNFATSLQGTRERLHALGLESTTPVFVARDFDAQREMRARRLWPKATLESGYRETASGLERSLAHLDSLGPRAAAREAFLLGDRAVRQLVFDPMLPEPLISATLREKFFEAVRRYDAAGVRVWRGFVQSGY